MAEHPHAQIMRKIFLFMSWAERQKLKEMLDDEEKKMLRDLVVGDDPDAELNW